MKEKLQGVDPITNGEDHTNGGVNTKSSGDPAQSETPRTSRNIMHENRETWFASAAQFGGRPVGEGQGRTTYRHAGQESDSGVVPMKGSNKEGQPTAESLEGRPETKENDRQRHMRPTQCGTRMSQGLKGVRLGRLLALTPFIQGKSRMRETRSYGSVRGVPGDRHPYRDSYFLFAALRLAPGEHVLCSDDSVLSRTSATQPLSYRAPWAMKIESRACYL